MYVLSLMRKMHHGQNRGKQKSKLSKTREFNENSVKFLIFDETGRKFINFVQRGEIAICIIDLRGWAPLVLGTIKISFKKFVWLTDSKCFTKAYNTLVCVTTPV